MSVLLACIWRWREEDLALPLGFRQRILREKMCERLTLHPNIRPMTIYRQLGVTLQSVKGRCKAGTMASAWGVRPDVATSLASIIGSIDRRNGG